MPDVSVSDPAAVLRARLSWVRHYEKSQNAGLTCLRCGISRPTLRKWWKRFQEMGEEGLRSQSRRRKTLPERKLTPLQEQELLTLRKKRRLGPKRLQSELMRQEKVHVSTATLWRVLKRHNVSATLRPPKQTRIVAPKRYSLDTPGQRVQIDSCKIGKSLWQFTAVDDCTRMRVLGLYSDHQATRSVHFVRERVLKEFPFPIQRIQTDRGSEFMADVFQTLLQENKVKFRPNRPRAPHLNEVKFRPNRPRAPHLNGKVERSQQTDRVEFWAGVDLSASSEELDRQQRAWQAYYNQERMHSALSRKTPQQKWEEAKDKVPSVEQVHQAYDPTKERKRTNSLRSWQVDEPAQTVPKIAAVT